MGDPCEMPAGTREQRSIGFEKVRLSSLPTPSPTHNSRSPRASRCCGYDPWSACRSDRETASSERSTSIAAGLASPPPLSFSSLWKFLLNRPPQRSSARSATFILQKRIASCGRPLSLEHQDSSDREPTLPA